MITFIVKLVLIVLSSVVACIAYRTCLTRNDKLLSHSYFSVDLEKKVCYVIPFVFIILILSILFVSVDTTTKIVNTKQYEIRKYVKLDPYFNPDKKIEITLVQNKKLRTVSLGSEEMQEIPNGFYRNPDRFFLRITKLRKESEVKYLAKWIIVDEEYQVVKRIK